MRMNFFVHFGEYSHALLIFPSKLGHPVLAFDNCILTTLDSVILKIENIILTIDNVIVVFNGVNPTFDSINSALERVISGFN